MNSPYLYEYSNILERVLSFGYFNSYSTRFIERAISYNSYFLKIENDSSGLIPIIDEETIIENIFNTKVDDLMNIPTYNQCTWTSEAYLRIQGHFKLSFECIFLYIPIKKMYEYFILYHEMDFSQIIKEFQNLYKKKSIFSILLGLYNCSLKDVSRMSGISYQTLFSLKNRRREFSKTNYQTVLKIAKVFHVRPETISELIID